MGESISHVKEAVAGLNPGESGELQSGLNPGELQIGSSRLNPGESGELQPLSIQVSYSQVSSIQVIQVSYSWPQFK